MKSRLMLKPLLLAVAAFAATTAPADARPKERAPDSAFEARQQGRIMPLPQIEARVRQQMRDADYLGPELDTVSGMYRFKFLRGERMIWIDVDGRTGQVLNRSGNRSGK